MLASITIAAIVVVQDWKHIHHLSAGWLVLASLFGIPLGLMLLKSNHQEAVKIGLAVSIIGFATYALVGRAPLHLERDDKRWLMICGFAAGILGGAYGMNGPPLAVYGSMRGWSARQFRATLQGYFLPASLIGMVGYWLAGLWTSTVTHYYLLSLPVIFAGTFLGRQINRRLHPGSFAKYVYGGLVFIGVLLLVQAI